MHVLRWEGAMRIGRYIHQQSHHYHSSDITNIQDGLFFFKLYVAWCHPHLNNISEIHDTLLKAQDISHWQSDVWSKTWFKAFNLHLGFCLHRFTAIFKIMMSQRIWLCQLLSIQFFGEVNCKVHWLTNSYFWPKLNLIYVRRLNFRLL